MAIYPVTLLAKEDIEVDIKKSLNLVVDSKAAKWIGSVVLVIVIAVLLIAGFGLGAAILLAFLVALIIYFGFLGQLSGAIIFVVLLNQVGTQACGLLNIWFASPKINETLAFLIQLGYVKGVVTAFFILSTISIFTGSIRIFRVSASASVKGPNEKKSEEE